MGIFNWKGFFIGFCGETLVENDIGQNFEIHWSSFSNEVMLYNIPRFLAF